MASKPPFLSGSSGGGSSASGGDRFPNRPQPMGPAQIDVGGSGGDENRFPNRPQPMSPPQAPPDPASIPGGGKLPFKGPSVETGKPFKLGGGE